MTLLAKTIRGIFLNIVLIIMLSASGVHAEQYLFVGSDFPVLSERLPDDTLGGISIDIARIICKRLGHTPIFELYPWVRAQALVKAGQADVLLVPYKTPEREKWMDFTQEPFFEDKSFFLSGPTVVSPGMEPWIPLAGFVSAKCLNGVWEKFLKSKGQR